ncbi:sigma-70 family RNA polymerase sigma factor [Variovorax paradoxus]|nr:sigma-70 family RNA polymerase sigma factor [Variovorax paradoxus]
MRTAPKAIIAASAAAGSPSPWLSIVTQDQRKRPVPTPDQLAEWLEAVARDGNRQAFAALFKHFAPRVKSFLMLAGASDALAEELTQETMVNVWRKARLFDPQRASPSTWVFAIARNRRVDFMRRQGNHLLADIDDEAAELPDPAPALDEQVLACENEARIRSAMARLSPEQVHILRLSFFEDQAHPKIAQALNLPLGTVKSRIRAAIGRLRQLLEGTP